MTQTDDTEALPLDESGTCFTRALTGSLMQLRLYACYFSFLVPKETASKPSLSAYKHPTLEKKIAEHENEKELRLTSMKFTDTDKIVMAHHAVQKNKDHHGHEKYVFCLICKTPLVDKPFACINEQLYCEECYDQRFAPRCNICHQTFKPGTLKLEHRGLRYHENCFTCDSCSQPIGTNEYIAKVTKNYCVSCYEHYFAPKCVHCRQVIKQNGVTFKNQSWHRECFRCTNCKNFIASQSFPSHNDHPYCVDCFGRLFAEKCYACNKPITGFNGRSYISAEGHHWHPECFICTNCKTPIASQTYTTRGDRPYCVDCFDRFFAKKCFACNRPITGPNGISYISDEGRHWHNDCFRCQHCRTSLRGRHFFTRGPYILCADCDRRQD